MRRHGMTAMLAAAIGLVPVSARAQASEGSAANNPLTPKITINVQDYYVPDLEGLNGREANQFLLRGLIPHKSFGQGQLFRFTLPLVTTPKGASHVTDFGDLTLQDLFVKRVGRVEIGAGPILVVPTAGDRATGSGKWQLGAAGILIAPQKWGLIGAIATYQHSIAGKDDRPDVSVITAQPLLIYNLPDASYVRSSATWSFNLEGPGDYVPFGLGMGHVWQAGKTTINGFVEPQYTVWSKGVGVPKWQIFFGVNFQFALQ